MRLRVRYRNRLDPKRRALDVKATVDRERMRAPLWKRFDGCRWVRKGMNPPILQTVLVAHEHPPRFNEFGLLDDPKLLCPRDEDQRPARTQVTGVGTDTETLSCSATSARSQLSSDSGVTRSSNGRCAKTLHAQRLEQERNRNLKRPRRASTVRFEELA